MSDHLSYHHRLCKNKFEFTIQKTFFLEIIIPDQRSVSKKKKFDGNLTEFHMIIPYIEYFPHFYKKKKTNL